MTIFTTNQAKLYRNLFNQSLNLSKDKKIKAKSQQNT